MPSRNTYKIDIAATYYHIYARGASKQKIFQDTQDYKYFLALFERYLSSEHALSKTGVVYPNYRSEIELTAYCLMQNHFHLLVYQIEQGGMKRFMQSVMTSYSRYFNLKYKRSGPLFESRYKAARIDQESYLQHISRYIHLNPRYWERYRYSSLRYYLEEKPSPVWLQPDRIKTLFGAAESYRKFVNDYEANHRMLEELKQRLAGF